MLGVAGFCHSGTSTVPQRPPVHRPAGLPQRSTQRRKKTAERGYGYRWQKYRLAFLRDHPICVRCEADGKLTPATQVDHVVPVNGADDPAFFEPSNHQALCQSCHSTKTNQEDGGFGRTPNRRGQRYVVVGPPGSGKSTWVNQRASWGDLVWDLDDMAETLCGVATSPRPPHAARALTAMRSALLSYLAATKTDGVAVYVITSDVGEADIVAKRIGAQVVTMDTGEEECVRRIRADEARRDDAERQVAVVREWLATAAKPKAPHRHSDVTAIG
jgi:5-methylcytosine-specific restriction endonuclease McrA